jgi:hypothetical protein
MNLRRAAFMLLTTALLPLPAAAQWQNGDLALRTSGSVARSGDGLRVDLVALSGIPGPFSAQVAYRFKEQVTVKDEEGAETTAIRERVVTRARGPVTDYLDAFATVLVDDTFHFGQSSVGGRYDVEVTIYSGAGGNRLATLVSCVAFEPPDALAASGSTDPCTLSLRGIRRVVAPGWITFDGTFPVRGRYSLVVSRDNRILGMADTGVMVTGGHEVDINAPFLQSLAGQTVDILLHNRDLGLSTTLARVTIPSES